MNASLLEVRNLSVEYWRAGRTISAVKGLSLTLNAGETLGIVGESGSGKSTVALAILRLIRPQEGRIREGQIFFEGQELLGLPEAAMRSIRGRQISMIFQDPFTALNPVLPVITQLSETLTAHGLPARRQSLEEALTRVQLEAERVLPAYPHQLSGGQRQRVMIAMAILTGPKILLADEPTTALDVLVQQDILNLLLNLQRDLGMAMVLISHNLGLVAQHTQRMAVMRAGEIVETGDSRDVFRHPQQAYTQELVAALPRMTRQPG